MNSWDCAFPSPEMRRLWVLAREASQRVAEARLEHQKASPETRQFWLFLLADRIAAQEAIEREIRSQKCSRPRASDPLDREEWGPYLD